MSRLTREVQNIQNPALGAGLLWRFAVGYQGSHGTHDRVPLPLLFLVLPMIIHRDTEDHLHGTREASGLRMFAGKFSKAENSQQDLLLAIHGRMLVLRSLTMESIRLGLATRLLHLDGANVFALSQTEATAGIPVEVRRLLKSAEKLGAWCGKLTMHEIASILKVRF